MFSLIEIIIMISGSSGFAFTIKFIYGKWEENKNKKEKQKDIDVNTNSLKNTETIYKIMIDITQKFEFNYSHIFIVHNGGEKINELSKKKITIRWEYTLGHTIKQKIDNWQERKIDYDLIRFINRLLALDVLYIEDIDELLPSEKGITQIYNNRSGKELMFVKIGWIGTGNFLFLGLQRDLHENMSVLSIKQKNYIKHKASDQIFGLLENAKNIIRL